MSAVASGRSARLAFLAIPCALVAFVLLLASTAAQAAPPVTIAGFGSGAGKVDNPLSVAVRQSTGDLYVAEEANRRISKFDSEGNFLLAWGFGVADGKSRELQACGPAASPPTKRCFSGINAAKGNGAVAPHTVAVEQSTGDVFAAEPGNRRVSKFSPDGEFLLAFGGGVASGGAEGTGNIEAGSTVVKSVTFAKKKFVEGQIITASGGGIPAGTEISGIRTSTSAGTPNSIELSKPATETATGVTLTAAADPGNVSTNEKQLLTLGAGVSSGNFKLTFTLPLATTQTTANIPYNASAVQVQSALEALSGIGAGNVAVSSPNPGGEAGKPGGPYTVEFTGARYADTDVAQLELASGEPNLNTTAGTTLETTQQGALAAEVCTSDCVQGELSSLPGIFAPSDFTSQGPSPGALAFDSSGDLWVLSGGRLQRFSPAGAFLSEVPVPAGSRVGGLAIDPTTDDFYLLGPQGGNERQRFTQPTSGEYTLSFEGQATALIAFDADGETIQAALEGLPSIGPSNVRVIGPDAGDSIMVVFIRALGGRDVELMSASGGSPAVKVTTCTAIEVTPPCQQDGRPGSVRRLDSTGVLLETLHSSPGDLPRALGIDSTGNLYVGDAGVPYQILKFNPAGEQTSQFGAGDISGDIFGASGPQGNAITIDGTAEALYTANPNDDTVQAFTVPESGPLPDNQHATDLLPTTATLAATLNPEGNETTYRFEYVSQQAYEEQGESFEGPETVKTPEETLPGSEYDEEEVVAELEGLIPATTYHFRLVATNECNPAEECTVAGPDTTFTTRPAVAIEEQWATEIAATTTTLNAKLDPLGPPAIWWVEYGEGEAFDLETERRSLAAGFGPATVSIPLAGLTPGTAYSYRFVAEDEREGTTYLVKGEPRSFTAEPAGLGFELPDDRAWEMVSPSNKFGGRLVVPDFGVGGQLQAAANGDALAYLSLGSIEANPEGSRLTDSTSVLARRGGGGVWSSRDITVPHTQVTPISVGRGLEYKLFSTELEGALLEPRDATPLSALATERTPYLRENGEPPTYEPLVTAANVAEGTGFGGDPTSNLGAVIVISASADLAHVVLKSEVPLLAGSVKGGIYEWTAGELVAVSLLPDGKGVPAQPGSGASSVRHAISEDGTRVFWTVAASAGGGLFVRDTARGETVRLDVVQPGGFGVGAVDPLFQGASADGRFAFFTDTHQLSGDSSEAGADLYRCEVVVEGGELGCELTNLTGPEVGQVGESAEVQGILPAIGEDGSRAYLVALGVLDEEPNGEGESATPGQPNLYRWQEGEGMRFIATLSGDDSHDWGAPTAVTSPVSFFLSAAASPGGRYLTFMSERALTGYDNRDAKSGEPAQEVFSYDAQEDELTCVSCNPSGARPKALRPGKGGDLSDEFDPQQLWSGEAVAAVLPQGTKTRLTSIDGVSLYSPRAIHDNGRVFFNAADSLVPADSNGDGDVYQYEPLGTGSCSASSGGASIALIEGGCVSLISSGVAEGTSAFLDASKGGSDVFFYTPARLSVADEDEVLDVYDARVDGIPARLSPITECLGDACQPLAVAPDDPTPASAAFQGSGNVREEAKARGCPKGKRKVRRHGKTRCVKPNRHNRKHRRAKHTGRATR